MLNIEVFDLSLTLLPRKVIKNSSKRFLPVQKEGFQVTAGPLYRLGGSWLIPSPENSIVTYWILSFLISGVEIQCIGHFKLLFALLRLNGCAKIQQFALEVGNLNM